MFLPLPQFPRSYQCVRMCNMSSNCTPNSFLSKRAGEMVLWVKALAAKIDGLSLLPGTRSVEENLPRSCPLTSTHTNK